MTSLSAVLRCIECSHEIPLHTVIYRCPLCNGLLEVHHSAAGIKSRLGSEWRDLFASRLSGTAPLSSGVWSRREWVLPEIDEKHIVSLGEGNSALIRMERYAQELGAGAVFVKQCGVSHTGSFKDLGMTVLVSHVSDLISKGLGIRAVACASTGDTSAALAAYASYAGIPVIVFLPAGKISIAQLVQPLACGALVLSLDTDFDGCMAVVKKVTEDPGLYLANSMNPLRIEGQKTVAFEIVHQLGGEVPEWIVIPGGNLGNVSALGAGFQLMLESGMIQRKPRIAVAQAAQANPLYLSYQTGFKDYRAVRAGRTLASAIQIGDPVSYPRAVRTLREFDGVVEQATEDELSDVCARTDRQGLFNDPHTGVALACMEKLVKRGLIGSADRVVVVSTAHGLKFSEFKTGYHENRIPGIEPRFRNEPILLPPDVGAVQRAIDTRLASRDV